jgi:hypothetical protein
MLTQRGLALLFTFLKECRDRMTAKEIEGLIAHYLSSTLHRCEEDRATRDVSDDEREAISLALSDHLEQTHGWLIAREYRRISQYADELLETHKYTLNKESEEYQRLCRGLLQAQQHIFRIESERWDGDYSSSSPFPTATGGGGGGLSSTADPLPLTHSKLISEGLTEYFQHYAHREQRTNQEKELGFRRFLEIIGGDRPIQEVRKGDCIKFRDTPGAVPSAHSRHPSRKAHSGHAEESRSEAWRLYASDEEHRQLCVRRSPALLLMGHQARSLRG